MSSSESSLLIERDGDGLVRRICEAEQACPWDGDFLSAKFLYSDNEIRKDGNKQSDTEDDRTDKVVKMPGVASANHTDAMLIESPAVNKSADTDYGIGISKVCSDAVFGGVEEGQRECRENDRNIEPRHPSAFVRKPDLSFYTNGGRHLFRNTDLGWQVDRMIVAHGGLLPLAIWLCVWNSISTSVPCGASKSWEKSKSRRRKRGEDSMERTPDDGRVFTVSWVLGICRGWRS